MIDTADPHTAYWRAVASGNPHAWIAIATDYRDADRLMRQHVILLPGWPTEPATDWLHGPDAAWWWLPLHQRRVMIAVSADADAHLASLVAPLIEMQKPKRLIVRRYLDHVEPMQQRVEPAAGATVPVHSMPAEEVTRMPAISAGAARDETGHDVAA